MNPTTIWLAASLCFVCTGMWGLCYWAPRCSMPSNPCRRFILISPLRYKNYWGDEEDEHAPWWFNLGIYTIIMSCMIWPLLGWVVLAGVAMWMMWQFIQKVTESGPYAKQQTKGTN